MSQNDADEFVTLIQTVQKALELDREDIPGFARKELGFEFTEDELSAALSDNHLEEDELTEDQLEEAAGGKGGGPGDHYSPPEGDYGTDKGY